MQTEWDSLTRLSGPANDFIGESYTVSETRAAKGVEFYKLSSLCTLHRAEDCTGAAGLDAGGIWEIPNTKVSIGPHSIASAL